MCRARLRLSHRSSSYSHGGSQNSSCMHGRVCVVVDVTMSSINRLLRTYYPLPRRPYTQLLENGAAQLVAVTRSCVSYCSKLRLTITPSPAVTK